MNFTKRLTLLCGKRVDNMRNVANDQHSCLNNVALDTL